MSKVIPFRRQSVYPKMKIKKGGFLEELRSLLAPSGINPTVTALGLTAASRSLSKPKNQSPTKKRKSLTKGKKQKGGDLLHELIAPQGLSATATTALLLGANSLVKKSSVNKDEMNTPVKKAKRKTPVKKVKRKTPVKKVKRKTSSKSRR